MKLIALLLFAVGLQAQTVVNVKSLTISADATAAIQAWMVTQTTGANTGLNGAIDASTTSVTVADGSVMGGTDIIVIDGEAMQITAKTGKSLTVTRAALGTVAATHADKALVGVLKYKTMALLFQAHIANMVASIMDVAGYPTKATQDAIIATAQAAKAAAVSAAVQ